MRARLAENYAEWAFIALLAVLCLVLSLLQYHWTGEVSRAEAEHLRVVIHEQAQQFGHAFDSVLTENCEALTPDDEDVNGDNRAAIHLQCFEKWKAGNPRPLFCRLAVAVPTPEGIQLYEQSQSNGGLARISCSTLSPVRLPSN